MIKLLYKRYIVGFERISITGLKLENVLNIANSNSITLHNCTRVSRVCMECDVSILKKKQLQGLLPGNGYTVKTLSKTGLFSFLIGRKKRPVLYVGITLACIISIILSNRVWVVRLHGSENKEIINTAIANNIKMWHNNIGEVQQAILREHKDLVWASVSVKGAVADIYVLEKKPRDLQEIGNGDIVAAKDCVIKNLITLSGTAMVKNGTAVSAGQVLISKENQYTSQPLARGKAIASVWYYATKEVPKQRIIMRETGKTLNVRTVSLFGLRCREEQNKFESCNKTVETVVNGPLKVENITYFETREAEIFIDSDTALSDAQGELYNSLEQQIPKNAQATGRDAWVEDCDGFWRVIAYVEATEDVAVYQN